ncbi:aquaporin [Dermatophilaceae bacterium Soc4.6]
MTTPPPHLAQHQPDTRRGRSKVGEGARAAGGRRRPGFHPDTALRAGAAEAVGTFFLIYTGTATAAAGALGKATAGSPPDSLAVALAFGLVLVAMVGALGQVSGAHLNGAVTIGLAVAGKFPWRYVPTYLLSQLAGAIAGAGATWLTFGSVARDQAHLGATVPSAGVSDGRAFIVEVLITFLLVFVVTAVATDTRVPAALAAPSIGFALVAAVLIGGGITGGAVNPDRALGPAIMAGTYDSLWLYVVADIIGGVVAALLYVHGVGIATAPTVEAADVSHETEKGDWSDGDEETGAGNRNVQSATH